MIGGGSVGDDDNEDDGNDGGDNDDDEKYGTVFSTILLLRQHHHHPHSPPQQEQPQHIASLHLPRRAGVQLLPIGVPLLNKSSGGGGVEKNMIVGWRRIQCHPFLDAM